VHCLYVLGSGSQPAAPRCPPSCLAGEPCLVYDAIVHPDVIEDAASDPTGRYRHFLCTLVIQYLEQKVGGLAISCAKQAMHFMKEAFGRCLPMCCWESYCRLWNLLR
jgi:hypothetical protein